MNILKKIYKYWMKFVYLLGEVNSRIIFTVLYFTIFGPYAIILKFFFGLKKDKNQKRSFWLKKEYQDPTLDLLKRQF